MAGLSCKPLSTASSLKNIYSDDDTDSSRRHEATAREVNWTVKASGCSGILLSPTLVLSANHCNLKAGSQMRSGWSVYTRGPIDLVVQEVLEANADLDYAIARVRFTSPMPSAQTFPPYIATRAEELYASSTRSEGDRLFTVGFPDDKAREWTMTYAEGQLKTEDAKRIYFNVGVINGNSGGGLLKKENAMLVGIAVGGSKAYNEAGWNQNSLDEAGNWNFGTPTWAIYQVSPVLQEQFPGGRNKYFGDIFLAKTQIFLSLTASDGGAELKVSAGLDSQTLLLCPAMVYPCSKTTSGVKALSLTVTGSGRRFYAASGVIPKDELSTLGLVALDKDDKVIGQRKVALQSKGAN
jgi:V8-like Glu-specific endopeptidase